MSDDIRSVLDEKRVFPPPAGFARRARLDAAKLASLHADAAEDHRRRVDEVVELDADYAARATQADAAEAARALAAIRELPQAYRDTLMLRLVEGMSGAEIAERTGLTPGSVRVNLHRGMQLLRDALGGGDA